ncbi:MAG: pyridoxamine 5'-phosphate oxidase family protein [Eubacteriaceae bacterium]|nr:pyridoxamine 5'-phosphate oxidase family protein [Eubacteriaceae bacterium]
MRRMKQALSEAECVDILKKEPRGVLSVIGDDGYPYGMPLNQWYHEDDGKIYFHGAKFGHKIDAMRACDKASFCVYDSGFRREGEWALNIKCVIVFGRIEWVTDFDQTVDISRRLCTKFTDDADYIEEESRKSAKGTLCFALVPEHITGKLVNEA